MTIISYLKMSYCKSFWPSVEILQYCKSSVEVAVILQGIYPIQILVQPHNFQNTQHLFQPQYKTTLRVKYPKYQKNTNFNFWPFFLGQHYVERLQETWKTQQFILQMVSFLFTALLCFVRHSVMSMTIRNNYTLVRTKVKV